MNSYEIRIAGFGGQGVVLSGVVLGRAAALYAGKEVTLMQSYGPEARGGSCKTELVLSDEKIDYPLTDSPSVLVAMNRESLDKFSSQMNAGGILLYDSTYIEPFENPALEVFPVPGTRIAEELGSRIVANMVMLGSLVALVDMVSLEDLNKAVAEMVPPHTLKLNTEAVEKGYEFVQSLREDKREG